MTATTSYTGLLGTRSSANYETPDRSTTEGALLVDNLNGQYSARNYNGSVFFLHRAAVTVPVNAATLVSVCGIYNPPGSGKILEIIDTDISLALATTVVQSFVWVSSTVAASAAATFTTATTARSRRVQDTTSPTARVYSAVTHSGTPDVEAYIGGYGATTSPGMQMHKKFDGTLMIPAGVLASIATLTAASTSSGINIGFTWAEIPA